MHSDRTTFGAATTVGISVETTGPQDGDAPEASRGDNRSYSRVTVRATAGDVLYAALGTDVVAPGANQVMEVTVQVGGDQALLPFADALEWAGRTLRQMNEGLGAGRS